MTLFQSLKAWRLAAFVALTVLAHASKAQIMLPQYHVGQYRSDVVYVGSYNSSGTCNFDDGLDFVLVGDQFILPTGVSFAVVIDTPEPANLPLTRGWMGPASVGDSTTLVAPYYTYGIAALQPGIINFHITASGTPTEIGQYYGCWIDMNNSTDLCNNTWGMLMGEALVPCQVLSPQQVGQPQNIEGFTMVNNQLIWKGLGQLNYILVDLAGRQIQKGTLEPNSTEEFSNNVGIYALTAIANGQVAHRKLILHPYQAAN